MVSYGFNDLFLKNIQNNHRENKKEFFNFLSKLKIYFQLTQIHSNILLININNSS